MNLEGLKYLVVGAGFYGAVTAERIAADLGERVLVIDKRSHVGGNSYSENDPATGIECHVYGSHIFHTSDPEVWSYLCRFASLNHYRHQVLTLFGDRVFQMPINLATINAFYGVNLTPAEAREFIRQEIEKESISAPKNLEEKAISLVGRPLYEAFVKGYTVKQWETDPRLLPADIITRLPFRFGYKSDYFNDPWQGIPLDGYAPLFRRMLDHPNVELRLGTDFFAVRDRVPADCRVIFTGPIDRFFDYRFGRLGWRTLRFEKEVCPVGDFQGTTVMNYADAAVPYTRIHEFRHYHEERDYPEDRTVIYREYSRTAAGEEEPYYPIGTAADREMLELYQDAAQKLPNVSFGGRLGNYRYLDMDKAIQAALQTYQREIKGAGPR
ncbi:UDP-galactopyranose mutase [Geomesophilobacter sediminis]|uniref:UDP-galactopyranose mutase n=1 Tax=Geomesophilobacter sediminis TaxID=2798584 RepID=A0A8J7M2B7_9BACT|nr:UDP-galactopyranose mutase [Geomesophilobacter sediminis]MBJ6727303.1 UDP-galactopyranose mutase [Geomesophilobacter sediminis]